MALAPRLDLRLGQQLVMTPQLRQAITLLQMSNLELESVIMAEVEKNPLIEIESGEGPDTASEPPQAAAAEGEGEGEGSELTTVEQVTNGNASSDAPLDMDYGIADPAPGDVDNAAVRSDSRTAGGGEAGDIEAIALPVSLADHLAEQAAAQLSGANLIIAHTIIDQIDECGYFRGQVPDVADRLSVPVAQVRRILQLVQSFDPSGVGATTLAQCLAIQARERGLLDRPFSRLLQNLDYLARGDTNALRRICGLRSEELLERIRQLRSLNPKPGWGFGESSAVTPVVPDVFVRRSAEGWTVELNSATLPKLIVNREYYTHISTSGVAEQRSYAAECMNSANWLLKALDQRARTITRVATEIVRLQKGFFDNGVKYLRPLNLRTVAAALDLHESTVSRVTAHKYMSCERGTFELRYFFTPGLAVIDGAEGDAVSAEAVKQRIRALIASESPDHVLSDDRIVELLRGEGFDVARRTVAKYREGMHIGSSVQRRRQLALTG